MEKEQAKRILDSLIRRSVQLRRFDSNSTEFIKWKRDTKAAIANVFGENTEYIQDFNKIYFSSDSMFPKTADNQNAYLSGLEELTAILQSMYDEIDQYWSTSTLDTEEISSATTISNDPTKVFVIHGRDPKPFNALCSFLTSIGLNPIDWNQALASARKGSPNIAVMLDTVFNQAQVVVVLLTGDDNARLQSRLLTEDSGPFEHSINLQSRPNILFESGMAMGRYPERTILVQIGQHVPIGDIAAGNIIKMDNTPEKRQELATKLANAGCRVDTSGTEWFEAGNFDNISWAS